MKVLDMCGRGGSVCRHVAFMGMAVDYGKTGVLVQ